MEPFTGNNSVTLRGTVAGKPRPSHESHGISYSVFPLRVERLSGAEDTVNILARSELLTSLSLAEAPKLSVLGEMRTFNNKSGQGSRLVISVYARELAFDSGEDENEVLLRGTLCRQPNFRTTPMGREICDLMLAVNRRYGMSDYLPCIAWGLTARECADRQIGERVALRGRLQSRRYIKTESGFPVEKTAFEISVMELETETYSPSH